MAPTQESFCPLIDEYLDLVDNTEAPTLYHRWSMLACVAALLNRRTMIDMPTGPVYPNLYMILLGPPAARKSTAIKMATDLLRESGYQKIAGGSTTHQKFLEDLYAGFDNIDTGKTTGDLDLDYDAGTIQVTPNTLVNDVFISEGELQDFFGINNFGFISLITNLFDNLPYYDNRTKHNKSERLTNPTLTLLGGATNTSFKKMFPLEIVGQGLLSRFLLIHGAGPRKKEFMPPPLDADIKAGIVDHLRYLRTTPDIPEKYEFTQDAYDYSRILYESTKDEIVDSRFQYYNGRRNLHYLKLVLIIAVANQHTKLELSDCFLANTILSYTEKFMPKALGEFGLDKTAELTELVYNKIRNNVSGITIPELFRETLASVQSAAELSSHVIRLHSTSRIDKIQDAKGIIRYIPIERKVDSKTKMVDYELLQEYRENPTFDTALKNDPAKEIEYEIQLAAAELEALEPDNEFKIVKN